MSNPAVITLAQVQTKCGEFSVEDNLGESIHLHLGDFRWDITINDLDSLSKELAVSLEMFINVEGFGVDKFSKEFLLQLAENHSLPYLESVEEDNVMISDIQIPYHRCLGGLGYKSLLESNVLKALNGDTTKNDKSLERNYYNQTSQDRVEEILESVKEKGYPYGGQKVVLHQENNRIYDGQHRAACLFFLEGNKELPVMRIGFSHERSEIKGKYICVFVNRWKGRMYRMLKKLYSFLLKIVATYKLHMISLGVKWDKFRFMSLK